MEKKTKRLLSLALALVMVIGLVPNFATANSGEGEPVAGETANYRWETTEEGTGLTNITTEGYTANGFTANVGGTVTGRKIVQYYAELENTIILRPTDAWEIEWKGTNSTGKNSSLTDAPKATGRILLCSGSKAAANGAQSVYLAEMYAMCQYGGPLYASAYNQLGNKLTSGSDGYSGVNTYTIKNVPDENGATIQLYVNGVYAFDLNKVYRTGSERAGADATRLENATYYFNYIGDETNWGLGSPEFHYLEIRNAHVHSYGDWVKGETEMTRTCECGETETVAYTAYRWEINNEGTAVNSVETNGFYVENSLTGSTGTVSDGNLSGFKRIIENAVPMAADKPWVIEWKAAGTWKGMLLSKTTDYSTVGNVFVYHPESGKPYSLGSKFTHPSNSTEDFWNYGLTETAVKNAFTAAGKTYNIDDVHTFRIENRISEGTNVWYLVIDDVEIGAMTNVYNGSKTSPTFTGDTILMQKDFTFGYIGATSKLLTANDFSYIEIWPNGEPAEEEHVCDFTIEQQVVKGEDCEHVGYTVWACECGETQNLPNDVYGDHDYYAETEGEPGANCQTPGYDVYRCSRCLETENRVNAEAVGDHIGFGEWYYNGEKDCVERSCACGATETAKISFDTEDGISVFDDLNAAVAAAPAGTTIFLWEDTTVVDLELSNELTVDIQGHVLTVTGYLLVDEGNRIVDYFAGQGLLKVAKDRNTLLSDDALYIWNGVDGYVLGQVTNFREMTETPKANTTVYYFLPEINPEVHAYLKAGSKTTEVNMIVSLFWEKGGVEYNTSVKYTDELVNKVLDSYDPETGKYALAYKLTVTGTDAIDEGTLKFYVSFVNGIWA